MLWQRKVDNHPNATITGTPTLAGGHAVRARLVARGDVGRRSQLCLLHLPRHRSLRSIRATGRRNGGPITVTEAPRAQGKTSAGTAILGPSGAPVWNSPTYDAKRGLLYFGSGENYSTPADGNSDAVIAVDAKTGKRKWTAQLTKGDAWNVGCMMGNDNCPKEKGPDLDVAASPLLIPIGGGRDIIVAGQKSGVAHGIDPDTGKILWRTRLGHGGTQGGVHFGMAAEGNRVFVPINDMADTKDGRKYDAQIRGAGLHAIDAATGRILWRGRRSDNCAGKQFCDPGIPSAVTAIPGSSSPVTSTGSSAPMTVSHRQRCCGLRHQAARSRRSRASMAWAAG